MKELLITYLTYAAHQVQVEFEKRLKNYGCSWPQALTIGFIKKFNENNKTVNQKDIAEAYGIKGPSVTSLIKTMEKNGFITRVKNKNDARSYDVFLTEKGEEVFHQVKKAFFEYDGEFSKKLSDDSKIAESFRQIEDKKEFLRLMKIVTENPPPDSMKIDR